MFTPSKYQTAIRDWVLRGMGNAIVNAVPGSGKTTTLVWLVQFITGTLAFLSFGRNIVATLAAKCPRAFCKTYNALGMAPIRQRLAGKWIKLHDGKKVPSKTLCILFDMYPKMYSGERSKEYFLYSRFCVRLVSLAKNAGIGALVPDTFEAWQKLIVYHGLTLDSKAATEERAIEISRDILRISNDWSLQGKIDFDDQLYLVALWDLELPKFDWLLVDEFQDTNAIQVAMIQRMFKAGTRALFVGDEKQGIYGFRGADAQAMSKARETFKAQDLNLNVCYRCSKAVVNDLNTTFPEIGVEACADAPAGKVESLTSYNEQTFQPTDSVICRNVAPLVKLAYAFILKRVACHILGREIGENLTRLVERMDASDVTSLQDKLDEYRQRETSRLAEKGRTGEVESINDQCDCLALFISMLPESNRTVDALIASIESLFADKSGCLTLSTIHKAKGLEYPRVFILDYGLIPSRYATQDWQLEQEKHLQWVAKSRARLETYYIDSDAWADNSTSATGNMSADELDAEQI